MDLAGKVAHDAVVFEAERQPLPLRVHGLVAGHESFLSSEDAQGCTDDQRT